MSWKDTLRAASFRGVEFKVEGHDAQFGRREVAHEFAQRDEPFVEDLGRKARTYTVDGYLIGDDYPAQRDKLREACEKGGAGELVHPYLGSMTVTCGSLRVRESAKEGRFCTVSLTFTEAGQAKFPGASNDSVRAISGAANKAKTATRSGFLSKFTTDGFPSFVLDSASSKVAGLSSLFDKLPVNPVAEAQAVAEFFDRVRSVADDALGLVTNPLELADRVLDIVGSVRDVFGSRSETVLRALRSGTVAPVYSTPATRNRAQEQANDAALRSLVRVSCLAEQAKAAATRAEDSAQAVAAQDGATSAGLFQTREEALAVRDELLDAIDAESEDDATTTDEFRALADLRSEVVKGVPAPSLQLPRQATLTPLATLPSLVLSYQYYGTAARAVEIAERNRARHPGFLEGGAPLQVVTDG
jgi:prophage DNA circulation protein